MDFFTPIVDDPYTFGQIAAANSLSDIYAMGGKPLFSLNIAGFPADDLPISVLTDILNGGQNIAEKAQIPILGGHTVKDKEPKYGMAVTGKVEKEHLVKNNSAKEGDFTEELYRILQGTLGKRDPTRLAAVQAQRGGSTTPAATTGRAQ